VEQAKPGEVGGQVVPVLQGLGAKFGRRHDVPGAGDEAPRSPPAGSLAPRAAGPAHAFLAVPK
jgi:hypothetical protein